eukprot:SAG11_NODE_7599_length_1123_cov_2.128906_1_plen_165_part_10
MCVDESTDLAHELHHAVHARRINGGIKAERKKQRRDNKIQRLEAKVQKLQRKADRVSSECSDGGFDAEEEARSTSAPYGDVTMIRKGLNLPSHSEAARLADALQVRVGAGRGGGPPIPAQRRRRHSALQASSGCAISTSVSSLRRRGRGGPRWRSCCRSTGRSCR